MFTCSRPFSRKSSRITTSGDDFLEGLRLHDKNTLYGGRKNASLKALANASKNI